MPRLLGVGRELHGVGAVVGPDDLGGDAFDRERLVAFVGEPAAEHDRFAELVAVAFDQQRAARRAAQEAALADVANQFGVEHFEVRRVERPQPPEFAAADVEHLAGAIKLAGHVDRPLVAGARFGVGDAGVDRRPGFSPFTA